jgi:predicted phage tail protein
LIQIPSNYVTRDQSTNGIAHYRRFSSNGAIHATDDQDWDGSFRDLQYTDNPAWVFYDIVTSNRYGLGTWIETTDIDKYALYRIARYCDELVPDGKGGTEPRFTANIYLAKATDSYKVLKDMATTFRAILFWSEGNILPVIDQAKDPIYNFTKGNVIDGKFNYEGTGSKLRSNQVAVTWNNPDNEYVSEVLLVEDRENIVKTGKIIIEEAVAFGATSMGQATRYGRWKLWTAINQSEVVSFKTAITGAFISPGDIINIQDADRYDTAYSGRISTTGTFNASNIP